jgi:integrase
MASTMASRTFGVGGGPPISTVSVGLRPGQPYTPDALTRKWHKITKTAGVRATRGHDARHSRGIALHLRGVSLR